MTLSTSVLSELSHWFFWFKPDSQLLMQVTCIDVGHRCIEHLNNLPTVFRSLAVSLLARFFRSPLTESLAQASIKREYDKNEYETVTILEKNPPEYTDII